MRKSILIFGLLILASSIFSQYKTEEQQQQTIRKEIDSLKRVLPAMDGKKKVDWLNRQAYNYFSLYINWKLEADSAYPYAMQAYNEAKKIGYKKGLGYAFLRLGSAKDLWFGFDIQVHNKFDTSVINESEQYAKKAMAMGQQINDNAIIGAAYWILAWCAFDRTNYTRQPDYSEYEHLLEKAISFYQKSSKQDNYQGLYRDLNRFSSENYIGTESAIGKLYSDCVDFAGIKDFSILESYENNALESFSKVNDKKKVALCYERLANIYSRKHGGSYLLNRDSEKALKTAISIYREIGDEENEMSAISTLCGVYFNSGDFEKGLDYGSRAMVLFDKLKQKPSEDFEWGLLWMSAFYEYAGDYVSALNLLYRLNPAYPDQVPKEIRAGSIGEIHRLMGNYDSAMYYLAPFVSDKIFFGPGKTSLGSLYVDLKQYDKGLQLILESMRSEGKKGLIGPVARGSNAAAKAYYLKGDYNSALKYARDGLSALKSINLKIYMVDNYKLYSDIFNKLGNNDSAYYYLSLYTILKDSLLNRQFLWRLNTLKKEAEEERKTSQINLLNKDNQIKNQQLKQQAQLKNFLFAGLLALLIITVFIYRNLSLKRKNEKLKAEQVQSQLQQKATDLEMQALRAQMNPHFIFNCLSSINRFILKNETETASDYLTRFSRLIRMVLIHSRSARIVLKDELEMLRLYLDMEQLRFKNSFDYNISFTNSIDPENVFIPPLLLQPFCENAIWHGLMHKEEKGYLEIKLSLLENTLNCIISDNGIGRQRAAELKSRSGEMYKSLGLKITTERLALMNEENGLKTNYHVEDIVDWEGNVAGTKVILNICYRYGITEPIKLTTTEI